MPYTALTIILPIIIVAILAYGAWTDWYRHDREALTVPMTHEN